MDLRGPPAVGGDGDHQRDDGRGEGPGILQASYTGRKALYGEVQGGISDEGRVHLMGVSPAAEAVSGEVAGPGADV